MALIWLISQRGNGVYNKFLRKSNKRQKKNGQGHHARMTVVKRIN
jgi:hypothetical protein